MKGILITLALLFGVGIGINHVVVDKLILGEDLAWQYDFSLFFLLIVFFIGITYGRDSSS